MRSAISCNITIVRTIALVSCLTRLHNFCINEVKRTKELDKDALPTDIEHMMNGPEGYVSLANDNSHDVPIPKNILDGVITLTIVLGLQGKVDVLRTTNYHKLCC